MMPTDKRFDSSLPGIDAKAKREVDWEKLGDDLGLPPAPDPKPPEAYKCWLDWLLTEKGTSLYEASRAYRPGEYPSWLVFHITGYKAVHTEIEELRSKAKKWDDHLNTADGKPTNADVE